MSNFSLHVTSCRTLSLPPVLVSVNPTEDIFQLFQTFTNNIKANNELHAAFGETNFHINCVEVYESLDVARNGGGRVVYHDSEHLPGLTADIFLAYRIDQQLPQPAILVFRERSSGA